jgi:hypothetical protein
MYVDSADVGMWEPVERGAKIQKKRVNGRGYQGMWAWGNNTRWRVGKKKRGRRGRRDVGTRRNGTGSGPDTPVSDLTAGVEGWTGADIKVDTVPTSMIGEAPLAP